MILVTDMNRNGENRIDFGVEFSSGGKYGVPTFSTYLQMIYQA